MLEREEEYVVLFVHQEYDKILRQECLVRCKHWMFYWGWEVYTLSCVWIHEPLIRSGLMLLRFLQWHNCNDNYASNNTIFLFYNYLSWWNLWELNKELYLSYRFTVGPLAPKVIWRKQTTGWKKKKKRNLPVLSVLWQKSDFCLHSRQIDLG